MTHHADSTPPKPIRVGVATAEHEWIGGTGNVVRVQAVDLRDAAQKAAVAHLEYPGHDVLLDIRVMIAPEARAARQQLAASGALQTEAGDTLLYVGTPIGLAGLIEDLFILGIADGACLLPMHTEQVEELIRDEVMPRLLALDRLPA